jgi:hypothetical protein
VAVRSNYLELCIKNPLELALVEVVVALVLVEVVVALVVASAVVVSTFAVVVAALAVVVTASAVVGVAAATAGDVASTAGVVASTTGEVASLSPVSGASVASCCAPSEVKAHVTLTEKEISPTKEIKIVDEDVRTPASREPPLRASKAAVERYTFPPAPQSSHKSVRVTSMLFDESEASATEICIGDPIKYK